MKELTLTEADFSLLNKLIRSMLHGELGNYPRLITLFSSYNLIFTGDEAQPVVRFIPEARFILKMAKEQYEEWLENN